MPPYLTVQNCWDIAITTYHMGITVIAMLVLLTCVYTAVSLRRLRVMERRLETLIALSATTLRRLSPRAK